MLMSSQDSQIIRLDRVEMSAEAWCWEFAIAQRSEISRYFAQKKKATRTVVHMHRYTTAIEYCAAVALPRNSPIR